VERALQAEMAQHLGHAKNDSVANATGNTRNGKSIKTLKGEFGELTIEIPRDRHASFEPPIIPKHQTRWDGFDQKILSLYARGMTVREIQSHLEEMYGAEVSPTLISSVTEAVMADAQAWQSHPLDALYPIVYLDCIHVKVRDGGAVRAKAVYLALGINMAGEKEVLGLWIAQTEGAKFWLQVVTELKNRGVQDIFIACVDELGAAVVAGVLQVAQQDTTIMLVAPGVVKAFEYAADVGVALYVAAVGCKCDFGTGGQELFDLFNRAKLGLIHVDHHLWMINPLAKSPQITASGSSLVGNTGLRSDSYLIGQGSCRDSTVNVRHRSGSVGLNNISRKISGPPAG
jgi:hypothetical protein